jgi:polyhydroxybutyrate depolymerase
VGIGFVAVVLLAACGGGDEGGGEDAGAPSSTVAPTTTVASAECPPVTDAVAETRSSRTLESGGATRDYVLEVPEGYDGTTPEALIIDFHGFGSSGEEQAEYSQLGTTADAIVATPTGTGNAWDLRPVADNPELAFTRELVDAVSTDFCVDSERIYATGISNGSVFSALLACQEADLFAGVAMVAATVGPDLVGCEPSTTTPVLIFHGTADPVGAYEGGPSGTLTAPVMESLGIWAERNGCDAEPVEERIADDVVHLTYEGCVADVEHYRIEGGGHVWPGADAGSADNPNTQSIDASEIISAWFLAHPRID